MKPIVFRNYGGIHQLRIESAEDLAFIHQLHPARWAATSVQIESLQCDPAFLKYLNQDGSGTIRAEHLRAAVRWIFRMMAKGDRMAASSDVLCLADLDTSHEEGRKLKEAAIHILGQLKVKKLDEISLEQVRIFRNTYGMTPPNGDGVLPPQHVSDPAAAQLAKDVLEQVGSTKDISGAEGINEGHLRQFLDGARKHLAWKALAEDDGAAGILPWDDDTAAAVKLTAELDAKIEQFFWQCDLVKLDARTAERICLSEQDLQNLDGSDLGAMERHLVQAPLQTPNAEGVLNLQGPINPYYQDQMEELQKRVLARAQPDSHESLSRTGWQQVKAIFEPYGAWQAEKPSDGVGELSETTLKEHLDGPAQKRLLQLLLEDLAVKDEVKQVTDLEKLILYQRWLLELANNFVSFSALYDPSRRALFELGDLIIDGRELAFTMKVRNRAEHKKIAQTSKMFLVYAEITMPQEQGRSFEIAAALTAGGQGALEIGKRGIFYDLQGKEWDARVVDMVENPISLWEAIKSPFVKAKKLLSEKVEAFVGTRAGSLEKATTEITTKMEKGESLQQPAQGPSAGAAPPSSSGMRDMLLVGGVAFAAVGSSLVYLIRTLSQISLLKAGLALLSLVLVVALFSALSGWNKLRKRDMSALLEACGWAVNFRMYMTRRLGYLFSHTPHLPEGARKERRDLVTLFLRQTGYGGFRWARVGLVSLLAALLTVALLSALFWNQIKALLQGWLSG
ncbi:MAG: hypothetical protein E2P05_08145 [Acidobacteria bacterium]|nr:MAG: hypothetical protein E2P05_08145 [Acidobacteriota bacterium]